MDDDKTIFLRKLLFWVNDNVGNGDGTQHIRTIWQDDPKMAEHLVSKWNNYINECCSATNEQPENTNWPTQQLALIRFLFSLSDNNLQVFINHIMANGRFW